MLTGNFSQPWPLVCSIRRVTQSRTEADAPAVPSPLPTVQGPHCLLTGQTPGPGLVEPMEGPPLLASKGAQAYATQDVPMEGDGSYTSALNWSKETEGKTLLPLGRSLLALRVSRSPHCCSDPSANSGEPTPWPWLLLLAIRKQLMDDTDTTHANRWER